MYVKTLLVFFSVIIISACSDSNTSIFSEFPATFKISEVNTVGISSYYFTDSIIYKTNNDLTDEIDTFRSNYVNTEFLNSNPDLSNFFIQGITFESETSVSIQTSSGNFQGTYDSGTGLGATGDPNGGLGFKINTDDNTLLSCITLTSKRIVDSIFEGDFIAGLDTLYNRDSTLRFQLEIQEDETFDISLCQPFNELDMITDFSNSRGLSNNERIVSHRTDFIFTKQ